MKSNYGKGIHTDFKENMTYGEYLQLDSLLSSQKDYRTIMMKCYLSLFTASEFWMKLILHELNAAIESIKQDKLQPAFKMLARVSKIQSQIIQSWDILATLTPSEYIEFRDSLGQASGFQSYQYRMIEYALGYKTPHALKIYEKDPELHARLHKALHAPSLYDVAIQALVKEGFPIHKDVLNRDITQPYEEDATVEAAWLEVYADVKNIGIYISLLKN